MFLLMVVSLSFASAPWWTHVGETPDIGARRIGRRRPNRSQNAAARLRGSFI